MQKLRLHSTLFLQNVFLACLVLLNHLIKLSSHLLKFQLSESITECRKYFYIVPTENVNLNTYLLTFYGQILQLIFITSLKTLPCESYLMFDVVILIICWECITSIIQYVQPYLRTELYVLRNNWLTELKDHKTGVWLGCDYVSNALGLFLLLVQIDRSMLLLTHFYVVY